MLRKISILAVLCALPVCATALTVPDYGYCSIVGPTDGQYWVCNPGTGNSVGGDGNLDNVDTSANSLVIESGNGLSIQGGGLNVTDNMYVGTDYSGTAVGELYIETGTDSVFDVSSLGAITIDGTLNVAASRTLNMYAPGANTTNMTIGAISNLGILNLYNIDVLNVGAGAGSVTTAGNMTLSANSISAGAIANDGGYTNIKTTGALTMSQFTNNSTDMVSTTAANGTTSITVSANINAGSITAGTIQNNTGARMNIDSAGDVTVSNLWNSGEYMRAAAGAMSVTGTMKNDSTSGTMALSLSSLNVSGGTASSTSFANAGNFDATVSGNTHFEYGFDLSTMGTDNTFSLDTGTLSFGTNMDQTKWEQTFHNKLDQFELIVRNGDFTAIDIVNGASGNTDANMDVTATSVNLTNLQNSGAELNVTATNAAGELEITDAVTTTAGSTTELKSAGQLTIGGGTTNRGDLTLNGANISLQSVTSYGDLEILALTSTAGSIDVSSNLINDGGTLYLNSRQIGIDGALTTTNGGTTSLVASDTNSVAVNIGSLNVLDGTTNIDAILGLVVTNAIDVDGMLNFSNKTASVTAGGTIDIAGNLTATNTAATGAGDVNIAYAPEFTMTSTTGTINIGGNIVAEQDDTYRTIKLNAANITVGQDVTAANKGTLVFNGNGTGSTLKVDGAITSNTGGSIDLNVDQVTVDSLSGDGNFIARGTLIDAADMISVQNRLYFDGTNSVGRFNIVDTNDMTLRAVNGIGIASGMTIGAGNALTLDSDTGIAVSGTVLNSGTLDVASDGVIVFNDTITNTGTMTVDPASIQTAAITNNGTMTLDSDGTVRTGDITNGGASVGNLTINGTILNSGAVNSSFAGSGMVVNGTSWDVTSLTVTDGFANLNLEQLNAVGNIDVTGNLVQGGNTGTLNLTSLDTAIAADNLRVTGDLIASSGLGVYNLLTEFNVANNITINSSATTEINAPTITVNNVDNAGILYLTGNAITLNDVVNTGTLSIDSGTQNNLTINSLTTTAGSLELYGIGMDLATNLVLSGTLMQNVTGPVGNGNVNIISDDYVINAPYMNVAGINQTSGKMILNTSDIDVGGDIVSTDLKIVAVGTDWLTADIAGDVTGGGFIGLQKMTIGGDYILNDDSILLASILARATTPYNYWATIDTNENSSTFGQITNGTSAEPLISINGKLITDLSYNNPNMYYEWDTSSMGDLASSQIGINLFDIVDGGSAIWLVHADEGVEELANKTRNLVVRYCNASGTHCFNYLESLGVAGDENDLPVYTSMRDTDNDGVLDSLYVVFDPRFGGPVETFKIQPIVDREPGRTDGEYQSAGAIDNLIAGRLQNLGFYNRTPIEVIPAIFENTNLEEMSNELYARMEQYLLDFDTTGLTSFSRLFQPREIEQVVNSIALNEHTTFRDFEDRMYDEFIWNRNRKLKKAWLDVDYGMFDIGNMDDGKTADGARVAVAGGFDWQDSKTLIMGVSAHVSNMSSDLFDEFDLGYKPGESIAGRVDANVADTNIGIGGYLMKTLSQGARLYGNVFLDAHLLSVSRDQNFVAPIDGGGTAFSVISEWGVLHDWLNQYIVGNVYARGGYNFGFDITTQAMGEDYMKLQSDGYLILTPGYSLTVQKRVYPSKTFQFRPNLMIGAEYDILGTPDVAEYRFASAIDTSDYSVNTSPLWLYAGGGVEFLHVSGWQFGLDYRYQHNADIQMHKVKLSGVYRF